ncbi:SIR2 family protein [Lactococcus sp. LG1074]|uniref:SIR2 family protein n=1 Tax=Lactococcus TaxID=1357 RepID=UPI001A8E6AA7|nr:SIR2 family protein [Lactococcus sp. LG1074]QSR02714.1 SIR2 family protein [Lactococcus sp. LG1074]
MGFIEDIKLNNQYPIIFIGSGITQRYFKDSPRWEELIIKLWSRVHAEDDYYSKYHDLQAAGKDDFQIFLTIAGELEKEIDKAFYKNQIKIDNLEKREAHSKGLSPFRQEVANIFLNLEIREDMLDEVELFTDMLVKARFIITTNYDNFIEQRFTSRKIGIKTNIGNAGLFTTSSDYGELYKIHGSVSKPDTITLTESDYEKNESKLALVNAKILSNLTESPILFLGYSLSDENIRELLSTYTENMPYEDISKAASRIGVVEYKKNENKLIESIGNISDLNIHYTNISTDNYKEIYRQISQIDQGILPSVISKYEGAFRKIIEVKGKEKELDTVLTSFIDISKISTDDLKNKNIVVAFGDSKYIYKIPTYRDYIREYFSESMELDSRIALIFLKKMSANYPVPYKRHKDIIESWDSIPNDLEKEMESFRKRIQNFPSSTVDVYASKAKKDVAKKYLVELKSTSTIDDVILLTNVPLLNRLRYILSEIKSFDHEDLKDFIIKNIDLGEDKRMNSTVYRKIVMSYSILVEGV